MTNKKGFSFLPLAVIIGFCLTLTIISLDSSSLVFMQTSNDDSNSRGNKQLNNVMSVAIKNGRNSGEFGTIDPLRIIPTPIKTSCPRELYDLDVSDPKSFEGALATVYKNGILRIGVTAINDAKVFSINQTTGVAQGILADVGTLVTNGMGLILGKNIRPSFVVYNFTSFFVDSLQFLNKSGKVDTVLDVAFLASRVPFADFSCPYLDSSPFAAFRDAFQALPPNVATPSSIYDLNRPEIRVAVVPDTSYEEATTKFLPLAQKVYFNTDNEVFDAVGKMADIVFYESDNVYLYNQLHDNRLAILEKTKVNFAGGSVFITSL